MKTEFKDSLDNFDKIYILDTNVILNDAVGNIKNLSDKSSNLIVIPETVLDETDNFKSGFDEINFQARSFWRLMENAKVIKIFKPDENTIIVRNKINSNKNLTIDFVTFKKYNLDFKNIPRSVINDRKIIEVARYYKEIFYNSIFLTNDGGCKQRAISYGLIETESLKLNLETEVQLNAELEFEENQEIKNEYSIFDIEAMDIPKTVQGLKILDKKGACNFFYKTGSIFKKIDEVNLTKQNITPRNSGQKILSSMMLDEYYDIVLSDSSAGTGKGIMALSTAMKLLDTHKDKYDKIVYIRKTIISDSEEIGFLPGSLDEKMSGFLAPLYSNLEVIVDKKYSKRKTKLSEDEKKNKIDELVKKYGITYKYEGHLRGDNLRNAIIIWDEIQNDSVQTAKLLLTRVSENCRVFILGSNRQIDNKYLNKHNNALTYIKNLIGKDNGDVRITGYQLDKTVRSKIAEWADNFK